MPSDQEVGREQRGPQRSVAVAPWQGCSVPSGCAQLGAEPGDVSVLEIMGQQPGVGARGSAVLPVG